MQYVMQTNVRRRCRSRAAAVAAVPLLLVLLSAIQLAVHRPLTEYLLLPPFAVMIYLIFADGKDDATTLRSIVILPCLGAIVGEACFRYFGMAPIGVAIATGAVLLAQAALRANMPPALALTVLAMLLRAEGPTYVLGVAEGTLVIFVAFAVWCRVAARSERRA
jgi:CBS-domain-containing membrane protein